MSFTSRHQYRQSPQGLNVLGQSRETDVQFLFDVTYQHQGQQACEHMIFDAIEEIIQQARELLVLDLFLYNDDYSKQLSYPRLARRVMDAVLAQRASYPELPILLITDPMNTFYRAHPRNFFEELRAANIEVVETNLDALRDSNPVYSLLYRRFFAGGTSRVKIPNVLDPDGDAVPVSSYACLLNFKANHRKVVFNEKTAVVSSANPHDASAPNHNVGFRVEGEIVADLLASEKAVYEFSAPNGKFFEDLSTPEISGNQNPNASVRLLTESGIRQGALELIRESRTGQNLLMGMFYLSERSMIKALKDAASRGVQIQVILDKNIDAFGRKKTGLPNLPVSKELDQAGIHVRWAATHGEQYHPKFLMLFGKETVDAIAGSGSFTRRNIADFNLETSLWITTGDLKLRQQLTRYWNRYWSNDGAELTQSLDSYKKPKPWHQMIYRAQEKTGISTF